MAFIRSIGEGGAPLSSFASRPGHGPRLAASRSADFEGRPGLLLIACQGEAGLEADEARIEDFGATLPPRFTALLSLLLLRGGRLVGRGEGLDCGNRQRQRRRSARGINHAFHGVSSLSFPADVRQRDCSQSLESGASDFEPFAHAFELAMKKLFRMAVQVM